MSENQSPPSQEQTQPKKLVDIHGTSSEIGGILGFLESKLRRFRNFSFLLLLSPLIFLCIFCIGVSLSPGVIFVRTIYQSTLDWNFYVQSVLLGISLAFGFFMYGISMILFVPLMNRLLGLKLKPWRGSFYSLQTIPWYYHNTLVYMVRYTFLDLVTPSPLNILFFRLMGMKIGKGVVIGTSNISDPCLITIEDYAVLGGSCTLFAHYGQKGYLIIEPVKIGKGATIGLKASIMGDVEVGEGVLVPPHTAVMPKTRLTAQQKSP